MLPKEDKDLATIGFGKALALTFFVIALGMFEKATYEIQDFFKKHIPH